MQFSLHHLHYAKSYGIRLYGCVVLSNKSMLSKSDMLSSFSEQLAAMNTRLLLLSTEIPLERQNSNLIKELLASIQLMHEQMRIAAREFSVDEIKSGIMNKKLDTQLVLLQIIELFHSTLYIDEIAIRILDSILGWIGAERGVLLLQDPSSGELIVKVGRGLNETSYESLDIVLPRTIVGRVLKEKRPVYSTDVQGDPHLMAMASIRDLNIRSLACLPLDMDGDILGIIYFDYHAASHRLGSDERMALADVCRHAAQALSNVYRYSNARTWTKKVEQNQIGSMIGASPAMARVFDLIRQVASTPDTSVLITGPSGTGKELVAHAIHDLSTRSDENFVAVNIAALPPTLLESELFGHEKGSFTDAKTRHIGLFEQADKGTIFLDEIAEMPLPLQTRLLRVLEERSIRRVGGDRDIPVNLRVIAATNKSIYEIVKSGEFREDLFYRLNVFPISLPPLHERGDDIVLIANSFINTLNARLGRQIEILDPLGPVARSLKAYTWPGNVRELRNAIERAMILCPNRRLGQNDFPPPICDSPSQTDATSTQASVDLVTLQEIENTHIDRVLDYVSGDKIRAAEILGIDLSTLYRKLSRRKKNHQP
jgi:DNA-binding NtrC family response regulator